eukprot:5297055-Alexandrium_andersonii.AAC.1
MVRSKPARPGREQWWSGRRRGLRVRASFERGGGRGRSCCSPCLGAGRLEGFVADLLSQGDAEPSVQLGH